MQRSESVSRSSKRSSQYFYTDVNLVFLSPYVTTHLLKESEGINPDFMYMTDAIGETDFIMSTLVNLTLPGPLN